ncbi:hypothetical protein [Profundibacterium mesophilum]|uniref:Uncharacterized protein n=1 Tax=Profundibacterium mesophilum KAUST100406-0324 TaxID=1037889 RepID=A0A921NQL8_9RHOB|nr:hypothetical protein [Profundibacterium mesophilum]KAF0675650.1 hypothetical protein PMES_01984 [Profundibacterium mesophilum KAUST100406-0324]
MTEGIFAQTEAQNSATVGQFQSNAAFTRSAVSSDDLFGADRWTIVDIARDEIFFEVTVPEMTLMPDSRHLKTDGFADVRSGSLVTGQGTQEADDVGPSARMEWHELSGDGILGAVQTEAFLAGSGAERGGLYHDGVPAPSLPDGVTGGHRDADAVSSAPAQGGAMPDAFGQETPEAPGAPEPQDGASGTGTRNDAGVPELSTAAQHGSAGIAQSGIDKGSAFAPGPAPAAGARFGDAGTRSGDVGTAESAGAAPEATPALADLQDPVIPMGETEGAAAQDPAPLPGGGTGLPAAQGASPASPAAEASSQPDGMDGTAPAMHASAATVAGDDGRFLVELELDLSEMALAVGINSAASQTEIGTAMLDGLSVSSTAPISGGLDAAGSAMPIGRDAEIADSGAAELVEAGIAALGTAGVFAVEGGAEGDQVTFNAVSVQEAGEATDQFDFSSGAAPAGAATATNGGEPAQSGIPASPDGGAVLMPVPGAAAAPVSALTVSDETEIAAIEAAAAQEALLPLPAQQPAEIDADQFAFASSETSAGSVDEGFF